MAEHTGPKGRPLRKGQADRNFGMSWTEACQASFKTLKSKMVAAPVLAYADFSLPFILEVDASHGGLGAVLSQEQGGKVRPIAYASRGLRPTERNMTNYSSMKLEFLALKWAVTEKCREYLWGNRCVVYMDNNPLSHLTSAKLGATEQQWAAELASFDFELKYRSGKSNQNADALSRQNPADSGVDSLILATTIPASLTQVMAQHSPLLVTQDLISVFPSHTPADMCSLQQADPVVSKALAFWRWQVRLGPGERHQLPKEALVLLGQWKRLTEQDGVLYRRVFHRDGGEEALQVVLPSILRQAVLTQAHEQHGHQGIERTTDLLCLRYWPGMFAEVARRCAKQSFMGHLLAARPNEILTIDFTVLEPS